MKNLGICSLFVVSVVAVGCGDAPATPHSPPAAPPPVPAATSAQPAPDRSFSIPPDEIPEQFDQSSGQTVLKQAVALIHVPEARKEFSVTGAGLTAAVLDTGLRTSHVDFRGRVAAQRNWTADNGGDDDNATDGPGLANGHGTNVTGIIAASEERPKPGLPAGEHTGVAPGARVIPLKVLSNDGRGNFGWTAEALTWILDNEQQHQISVVNMSLGDGGHHTSRQDLTNDAIGKLISQLRAKRIAVVVAAGNDDFKHKLQGMAYPAIFSDSVSVGAVYDADIGSVEYKSGAIAFLTTPNQMTAFSQRFHDSTGGAFRTDIFAPGAKITSSGINNDRGESSQQGTSQAAPVTAGVIMLLQEYHKRIKKELPTVNDVEKWLREGSVPVLDDSNKCDNVPHTKQSFPRVDALGALRAAKKSIAP